MNDDIVEQLREEGFVTHMARLPRESKILHAAADEIERLRRNTGCARNQRSTQFCAEALDAQREVARLTAERDEARREVCGFHHLTGFLAGDYAISRGWNYLNDERKWSEFRPSVKEFKAYLKGQEQVWLEIIENKNKRIKELEGLIDSAMEADYNNEYFRTHHK